MKRIHSVRYSSIVTASVKKMGKGKRYCGDKPMTNLLGYCSYTHCRQNLHFLGAQGLSLSSDRIHG